MIDHGSHKEKKTLFARLGYDAALQDKQVIKIKLILFYVKKKVNRYGHTR